MRIRYRTDPLRGTGVLLPFALPVDLLSIAIGRMFQSGDVELVDRIDFDDN